MFGTVLLLMMMMVMMGVPALGRWYIKVGGVVARVVD